MTLIYRGSELNDDAELPIWGSEFGLPAFVADVFAQTVACRAEHHCTAEPFVGGPFLGTLAAALSPARVLELGTALGYSTLWLAHGAQHARIDTVEAHPLHAGLARQNFERYGCGKAHRVVMFEGDFTHVLPGLDDRSYDLAFYDGGALELDLWPCLERLVSPGGTLITANLPTEQFAGLFNEAWLSSYVVYGNIVMSVRR